MYAYAFNKNLRPNHKRAKIAMAYDPDTQNPTKASSELVKKIKEYNMVFAGLDDSVMDIRQARNSTGGNAAHPGFIYMLYNYLNGKNITALSNYAELDINTNAANSIGFNELINNSYSDIAQTYSEKNGNGIILITAHDDDLVEKVKKEHNNVVSIKVGNPKEYRKKIFQEEPLHDIVINPEGYTWLNIMLEREELEFSHPALTSKDISFLQTLSRILTN